MQPEEKNNPVSFNWFLKSLKEQQSQSRSLKEPHQEQEIQLLRFIKVFEPPVEKLMEIGKAELDLSLLAVTDILEKLKANDEITFEVITKPGGASASSFDERIVKITRAGLTRLETGG